MPTSPEPAAHTWLWCDTFGHRVAAAEGWVCFARHDPGVAPLVVFGLLLAFPFTCWGVQAALGVAAPALANGWLGVALAAAAIGALAWRLRRARRRALDADPRGSRDALGWDAATGELAESAPGGARRLAGRGELTLDIVAPDTRVHGFSGTYSLVLGWPAGRATIAEAHADVEFERLVGELRARGVAAG